MSVCSSDASEIEMAWSLNLGSQSNLVNSLISRPVSNLVKRGREAVPEEQNLWYLLSSSCSYTYTYKHRHKYMHFSLHEQRQTDRQTDTTNTLGKDLNISPQL